MNKVNKLIVSGVAIGSMILAISPVSAVVMPTATPTVPAPTKVPRRIPRPTKDMTALKEKALNRARTATNKIFDRLLARLTDLKTRIQSNTRLGDEAKAEIIGEIDAETTWLTAQKAKVDAAKTVSEVRNLTKEARTHYNESVQKVRRLHIASGYVTSLENIVNRIDENIIPKTEEKLNRLADKGVDVTQARQYLADIQVEVDAAKALIPQIRNATTFEEARTLFAQARTHLGISRTLFKDMVTSLREEIEVLRETATPTSSVPVTETPSTTPSVTVPSAE